MSRPPAPFAHLLEPLVSSLWILFLVWTALFAVVWVGGIGEVALAQWFPTNPKTGEPVGAGLAARAVLNWVDLIWFLLAVANIHLAQSRSFGLKTARQWLLIVGGSAFVIGLINQLSGLLFGHMVFGKPMSLAFLGVPLGWLMLWAVLIFGARNLWLWMRPRAGHREVAVGVGLVVFLTTFNVLPVAQVVRGWWYVHGGQVSQPVSVPPQSWACWLLLPMLLAHSLREKNTAPGSARVTRKPAIILAILNLCALFWRIAHFKSEI